jgi:hypothetical protein
MRGLGQLCKMGFTGCLHYVEASISAASIGLGFAVTLRSGQWVIKQNGKLVNDAFGVIKLAAATSPDLKRSFSALTELERMRAAGMTSEQASRCWNWFWKLAAQSETTSAAVKVINNPDAYHVWRKAANEGFSDDLMTSLFKDAAQKLDDVAPQINGDGFLALLKDNPLQLRHWKSLFEAGVGQEKRIALDILEPLGRHFSDHAFLAKLGGGNIEAGRAQYVQIVKYYTGKCSTCGGQGYQYLPDSPEDYLEAVFAYTKKFAGKDGFQVPHYNNQVYSQDGFFHAMRHMNAEVNASDVRKIDMKFEGEGLPCQGCMFDLELHQLDVGELKLIEYKSVQNAAGIPLPQFTNYMFNISQISEMRYIFNAEKISLEQAKQGMQSFFNTNKMQVFEVIWGNQPLRSHLFPGSSETAALSSFSGLIDDTDSILYSFIMIY